jgi:small subunit ribosomal protein S16
MAVKLRLTRIGAKKHPFYRIVATDSRVARNGRYLENIGTYDPMLDPPALKLETEPLNRWLAEGATPSPTVARLIRQFKRQNKTT